MKSCSESDVFRIAHIVSLDSIELRGRMASSGRTSRNLVSALYLILHRCYESLVIAQLFFQKKRLRESKSCYSVHLSCG